MSLKKTELYIEKYQIDLFGEDAFILNFNVADLTDISAKAASYSKEVNIPASKLNNQTFSHLYDVNSEGYFNPISKKTAEVFVDGVCVMRGFFKLNSITITDAEYVTYHGVLYEDSINFIQALGDLELSNLHLPLTSSTAVTGNTTDPFLMDTYKGTDYRFSPPGGNVTTSNPAKRAYCADATNVTIGPGAFYGALQPVLKDWQYWVYNAALTYTSNKFINAFVAAQSVQLNVTATMRISSNISIKKCIMKVVPDGLGGYIHIPLTPVVNNSNTFYTQQITTNLNVGEGIYIYYTEGTGRNYGGSPMVPPPSLPLVVADCKLEGTITTTSTTPVNNLLIDEDYILNNMSTAVNSSNSDICFPVIDYNQSYPLTATSKNNNVITEGERPAVRVPFEDLRPGVFVKKVWDAVFKQSGFKYKSKFLDTNADLFKKLIVIGGMDEDEVQSLVYSRTLTGSTEYTLEEPIQDKDLMNGTSQTGYTYNAFLLGGEVPTGAGANWTSATTNVQNGTYTEKIYKNFNYSSYSTQLLHGYSAPFYGNVLQPIVAGKYRVQARITGKSLPVLYGVNNANPSFQGLVYRLKIESLAGGSYTNDPSLFTPPSKSKWKEKKVVTFKRDQVAVDQDFQLDIDEIITLKKGEITRVTLYASAEAQFDPSSSDATAYKSRTVLRFNNLTGNEPGCFVKYSRCGSWLGYVATDLTNMLPRNMKQKDFIMGISKMFNLYFEPDKQDPKTIYLEPRDTYYEDGRVLNWEKKLDYGKPIEISILPHDQAKNFVFKYMDDSSDYNTEQFKKFTSNGLTFGSYNFTSPDEYVTEKEELEVPFAASYLQKISGTDPLYGAPINLGPMVITKIIDPDSQLPAYDGDPSNWKKEPRILYYGGKIELPIDQYKNYDFKLTGSFSNGQQYETEIPFYTYAGHYNRPIEPTIDINFFTDTHYLPTTYWNNGYTTQYGTQTTSTTLVNLTTLALNSNVVMSKAQPANFIINTSINKYVKVISSTDPNSYFVGLVISNTTTTVTLKVLYKNGTLTASSWKLVLMDVEMKYNLFNVFYKNQMIELTDQTARLMTAFFNLNPVDITNFRFNDIIYAHKEYWRVMKIIDFDTSSDVSQTTKVELLKIVRADTNRLIDYIQGGYLGATGGGNGGINGTTTTTGGLTPAVVQLGPNGTPVQIANGDQLGQLSLRQNSIFQDVNADVPKYFEGTVTVNTGTSDLSDTLRQVNNSLTEIRDIAVNKPIGADNSVIYTIANSGADGPTVPLGVNNVYFDNTDRTVLFNITLQDRPADGSTVNFSGLNNDSIAFMRLLNPTATTQEIMVINCNNTVLCKYNLKDDRWVVTKL